MDLQWGALKAGDFEMERTGLETRASGELLSFFDM